MDNLTYTVYHQDSDKIVATGLDEMGLVDLINKMRAEELVKDIMLVDYMHNPNIVIDIDSLTKDIESQGVFYFRHTWHVG